MNSNFTNDHSLFSDQAFDKCFNFDFNVVWDIGSGQQKHASLFRKFGKKVYTIDIVESSDVVGLFPDVDVSNIEKPDLIWCSHCLEHQRNVGSFLDGIFQNLEEGKILAITVPPSKNEIVGGHLTLWNAGLLLYNLILAGFDCSEAMVKSYGYNISVITRKKSVPSEILSSLCYDRGDIEKISAFFPFKAVHGFDGQIISKNW